MKALAYVLLMAVLFGIGFLVRITRIGLSKSFPFIRIKTIFSKGGEQLESK